MPTAPATTTCPGCDGAKSPRAQLCADCRRKANRVGASVITNVRDVEVTLPATPAPARPRTPEQNRVFHGRLRELAQLEAGHELAKDQLWDAERKQKRAALAIASAMFGRELESSTELSELEMERLNEHLGDRIDELKL